MFKRSLEKQRQKIANTAKPYIEQNEEVKFAFLANTVPFPSLLSIRVVIQPPFSWIFGARPCHVVITDRNAYVLRMPMFSGWKRRIAYKANDKYPLNNVILGLDWANRVFEIGDIKLSVWPFNEAEAEEAIKHVSKF